MKKKPMNSIFLNYLIECESNIETKIDGWIQAKDIKNEINEMAAKANENLVLILACWGEIGWCLPKWKKRDIKQGAVLGDIKNNVSISEIDEKLANCFQERDIEAITILIEKHLTDSDKTKIDLAFELYLKNEYYVSAVMLASLIDSTSINQYLKTNPSPMNVSQCWKCYGNLIQENFGGVYFSNTFPSNVSAKDDKRAKATIEFFKSIRYGRSFAEKEEVLIPLTFSLLKFFDDSDWKDRINGMIPSSVNRHWLAHNMYDYDDITRADCIKLFCMLFQMIELYSML